MDPNLIQLFALDNGRWSWEVGFPNEGLNQDGYATSYAEARRCIEATIENAALPDDDIDACIPPEGFVE